MKKNLLEIYALAACFALMLFLVMSIPIALGQFLRVIAPAATVSSWAEERTSSDARYVQSLTKEQQPPVGADLAQLRREAFELALRSERHDGLDEFLKSALFVVVGAVALSLHWRLAQRERTRPAEA